MDRASREPDLQVRGVARHAHGGGVEEEWPDAPRGGVLVAREGLPLKLHVDAEGRETVDYTSRSAYKHANLVLTIADLFIVITVVAATASVPFPIFSLYLFTKSVIPSSLSLLQ